MSEKIVSFDQSLSGRVENKEASFEAELEGLLEQTYKERLAGQSPEKASLILKDNLDHARQVKENTAEIIGRLRAGEGRESFIPKDDQGRAIFDESALRAMAILHDVAKISEEGKIDTFHHHDRQNLEKILADPVSPVNSALKRQGFSEERIGLMIEGINRHSRRTDFIQRYFYNKNRQDLAQLPGPEGVLEYAVLSDADILTQSHLEQGVKKIVCSRLLNDNFRQQDSLEGRHFFAKTLDSAMESAQKVGEAMHFEITKEKARRQLEQTREFAAWLTESGRLGELDSLADFSLKKKRFDEFIEEFVSGREQEKLAA